MKSLLCSLSFFFALFGFVRSASANNLWTYSGGFSLPQSKGSACPLDFAATGVESQFALFIGRKALFQFKSLGPVFLQRRSLTGYLGASNDFKVETKFVWDGLDYTVVGDGLISSSVVALTFTVHIKNAATKEVLCHQTLEYSGEYAGAPNPPR